ncbi:MAG TPA: phosphatase PAP2 family protein [Chitinophaga sp.]|uniref:phosphatase PAP2 family protein n=1 Tax=Chitinophaga sp. TaxID=1869181 RepID=UPI002C812086|nr:phosphatase PAP2 family protein [Chitinophaga sp.]HVI48560.1 phosphatase PAP2 family protein [Chitinophaga sp.]
MKRMIMMAGLAAGTLAAPLCAVAQITNHTDSIPTDSSFHISIGQQQPVFRTTTAGIIVPALMLGYGFAALKAHPLKELNRSTKNELVEDHPTFHTHIDNYLQIAPAAAVYILNAAGIHGRHNLRDRTIILGLSALLTTGSMELIKHTTREERPDGSDNLSFPSGHTAMAFATAEFMRQEYRDVSPWYGVAGYAVATATGVLRMYNNKHWVSDVVAGAGLGILGTKAVYWAYPWIQRKLFRDNNTRTTTAILPYYNNQWHSAGLNVTVFLR